MYPTFLITLIFYQTFTNAEWNTKDYLKKEHSLLKPYHGRFGLELLFFYSNICFLFILFVVQ